MAALAFVLLILAITTGQSSANWCVCKDGVSDSVLQKALDYACGAGADCNPIHTSGACYNPNNVKAHCNYAVNSYFQRKGQSQGTCDFAGAASPTTTDPSTTGCTYPATSSGAGSSSTTPTTGTTPTSGTTPTTGTTPITGTTPSTSTTPTTSTTSPYTTTPAGPLGGIGTGVGPTGAGITTDDSEGFRLASTSLFSSSITLFFSGLMLWWG